MTDRREFSSGGMWPTETWEILSNVPCKALVYNGKTLDGAPCVHCMDVADVTTPNAAGVPPTIERHWVCPSVVVGTDPNEQTSAGICLDCILEATR